MTRSDRLSYWAGMRTRPQHWPGYARVGTCTAVRSGLWCTAATLTCLLVFTAQSVHAVSSYEEQAEISNAAKPAPISLMDTRFSPVGHPSLRRIVFLG